MENNIQCSKCLEIVDYDLIDECRICEILICRACQTYCETCEKVLCRHDHNVEWLGTQPPFSTCCICQNYELLDNQQDKCSKN
jgi:hypothetical protein